MADISIASGQEQAVKMVDLGDGMYVYATMTVPAPYVHIAGAATTVVKSGAGVLRRIVVNKAIALSVITFYDNTAASGAVIAIVTQPIALLNAQLSLQYELKFTTGLTVVTSAADDLTVVYW